MDFERIKLLQEREKTDDLYRIVAHLLPSQFCVLLFILGISQSAMPKECQAFQAGYLLDHYKDRIPEIKKYLTENGYQIYV